MLTLEPARRFDDLALLVMRVLTGLFLIFQSHDNVLSAERMAEFVGFCRQFGFPAPEVLAPLAVWMQFLAGFSFILGFLTRWFGLLTAGQFVIATAMVHAPEPFNLWWPALALVGIGLVLGTVGAGKISVDHLLSSRSRKGDA